jgi:hypothetical protein
MTAIIRPITGIMTAMRGTITNGMKLRTAPGVITSESSTGNTWNSNAPGRNSSMSTGNGVTNVMNTMGTGTEIAIGIKIGTGIAFPVNLNA